MGLIFRGGQWELLEVTDTTSNTLDSIGYTPLELTFRGGQGLGGTGDRGQGIVGTTESKSHDMKHIRLHWLHTFRVYLVDIFGCIDIIYVSLCSY